MIEHLQKFVFEWALSSHWPGVLLAVASLLILLAIRRGFEPLHCFLPIGLVFRDSGKWVSDAAQGSR